MSAVTRKRRRVPPKRVVQLCLAVVMVGIGLALMAHQLTGDLIHEIVGLVVLGLVVGHNVVGWRWYQGVLRRRPGKARAVLQLTFNALLLVMTLTLAVTSVLISREVFAFANISTGATASLVHTSVANWGLLLIGAHVGLYWPRIQQVAQSWLPWADGPIWSWTSKALAALISIYGVFAAQQLQLWSKLTGYYGFSMWDFETDAIRFFLNYLAIGALAATVTHYGLTLAEARTSKGR